MKVFEKTKSHPLMDLLEQHVKTADFMSVQQAILKKMPHDFDAQSNAIFYTPGEDYLEWIDIVEAAASAKGRFVMFELGAGYGRWCMNALYALKLLNPIPFHFVAVEAEKTHFRFLKAYFEAHGLNPKDYKLIEAAIDASSGFAHFHMGNPNEWYGQNIDSEKVRLVDKLLYLLKNNFLTSRMSERSDLRKEIVKTTTLNSLLSRYERVDLIDMDIQGFELPVLKASINQLNKKVKRLHIGTHSKEIDEGLSELFLAYGWKNIHLYPCLSTCPTPYGDVEFNDGIQSWVNPTLTP